MSMSTVIILVLHETLLIIGRILTPSADGEQGNA